METDESDDSFATTGAGATALKTDLLPKLKTGPTEAATFRKVPPYLKDGT